MKRQINRYFFMVTLAGMSFTAAFSQRAYTLDECLEQALANNVRLKNAQNNLQMAKEDKANAFSLHEILSQHQCDGRWRLGKQGAAGDGDAAGRGHVDGR